MNKSPNAAVLSRSGRNLAPLGQGGRAVCLECCAGVEMTVVVEMVVDRGMDGGELLQGFDIPEPGHRPFPSSKRLVRVLGSIVEPATTLLISAIADLVHGRPIGT